MRKWLLLFALPVFAQNRPVPYTYSAVADAAGPIAGKQVLDILSLVLDDRGDVAMIARCADGTGVWSSARNAWVAFTGQTITSGEGFPSPIIEECIKNAMALDAEMTASKPFSCICPLHSLYRSL